MKTTPFLQELVEARLYKGENTLKGKTAKEIANIVFLMFLALEILRDEDSEYAKRYVENTLQFGELKSIRSSVTDFGNLVAVLLNQDDYEDTIKTDASVHVPWLQLKRHLMEIREKRPLDGIGQTFLLRLEDYLKVSDSLLKTMRRSVSHWSKLDDGEKSFVIDNIKRLFNTYANYCDMYLHIKTAHFSFK